MALSGITLTPEVYASRKRLPTAALAVTTEYGRAFSLFNWI
jgi:hypothetical protein